MIDFNPNSAGIANGNNFGFPYKEEDADIVIIPVPWDATASYGKGSCLAPQAILTVSTQLDFFHHELDKAFETRVYMSEISTEWKKINSQCSEKSTEYIRYLEQEGEEKATGYFKQEIDNINHTQNVLTKNLKEKCDHLLNAGKIVGILGGEHSTAFALIQALNDKYEDFGILQIDAHADLRLAYLGFTESHASIMRNVLGSCPNMKKLVQVGVRQLSEEEYEFAQSSDRVSSFYDWNIRKELLSGGNWSDIVKKINNELPEHVYISFDIDGLRPYLCPNTGTPVEGGFEFDEIQLLLSEITNSGKKIIGFDLSEVSPSTDNTIDANFGAKALWELVCYTEKCRRKVSE